MTGEFTSYCNHYYQLTQLVARREKHLITLLCDAPYYYGQKRLSQVDDIISYYRKAQAFKAKTDKKLDEIKATERTILMIMKHFSIPPGTVLTGEIPGKLAYEVWADEDDAIHISKTKDLSPGLDNPNIIVIKFSNGGDEGDEDF